MKKIFLITSLLIILLITYIYIASITLFAGIPSCPKYFFIFSSVQSPPATDPVVPVFSSYL